MNSLQRTELPVRFQEIPEVLTDGFQGDRVGFQFRLGIFRKIGILFFSILFKCPGSHQTPPVFELTRCVVTFDYDAFVTARSTEYKKGLCQNSHCPYHLKTWMNQFIHPQALCLISGALRAKGRSMKECLD
jgi:hypothetical protein